MRALLISLLAAILLIPAEACKAADVSIAATRMALQGSEYGAQVHIDGTAESRYPHARGLLSYQRSRDANIYTVGLARRYTTDVGAYELSFGIGPYYQLLERHERTGSKLNVGLFAGVSRGRVEIGWLHQSNGSVTGNNPGLDQVYLSVRF